MRRILILMVLLLTATSPLLAQSAVGLGVNLPVVGRLIGSGNTLFATAVDVTNHTGSEVRVDFYFTATDFGTGQTFSKVGSVDDDGTLVAAGAATMAPYGNAHFDDFINSLVDAGFITATTRDSGVLGSVLFVFNGYEASGQGSSQARFYNGLTSQEGTVGVAAQGIEITSDEPQRLMAVGRDTRGLSNVPQLYTNIFINNTGLTPTGSFGGPVTIRVSALQPTTGAPLGTPFVFADVPPGATVSQSAVLTRLGVPVEERYAIIVAEVTSGDSAIQGLAVQVDNDTKDGAIARMTRGDF